MDYKTFLDEMQSALVNLKTLDIVTAVGSLSYDKAKDTYVPDGAAKAIRTRIDLLQGDITTHLDEEFAAGKYQALCTYHAAREKQGHDLLKGNLEALKQLFELAVHFRDSK